MRRTDIVRAAAGSVLALFLFAGGTCQVGVRYCSDDCDPCVSVCTCKDPCPHALALDFDDAYRMRSFVLALEERADGTWTRTYSGFVGLALDRALGPGPHDARAIELFARNVIVANAEHLGAQAEWSLAAVERAGSGLVATFERPGTASDALELLFDRSGTLQAVARHGGS